MSLEFAGLGGLFLAAFIASTLFPASSEAVLAGLTASGAYNPWLLIATASLGNVLGATVNWALGRWAAETRWVQKNARLARALAVTASGVGPRAQHSTMTGPAKPASLSVAKTPLKSTLPAPNWIMTSPLSSAQSLAQKPLT